MFCAAFHTRIATIDEYNAFNRFSGGLGDDLFSFRFMNYQPGVREHGRHFTRSLAIGTVNFIAEVESFHQRAIGRRKSGL